MYSKIIYNGYIYAITNGAIGSAGISEAEYIKIKRIVDSKPPEPDGFCYKLRADTLEWELVELPPEPEPQDEELTADEALNIILGGGAE